MTLLFLHFSLAPNILARRFTFFRCTFYYVFCTEIPSLRNALSSTSEAGPLGSMEELERMSSDVWERWLRFTITWLPALSRTLLLLGRTCSASFVRWNTSLPGLVLHCRSSALTVLTFRFVSRGLWLDLLCFISKGWIKMARQLPIRQSSLLWFDLQDKPGPMAYVQNCKSIVRKFNLFIFSPFVFITASVIFMSIFPESPLLTWWKVKINIL